MSRHAFFDKEDTIVALATPSGSGAIAVLRLSGPKAIALVNQVFKAKDLEQQASHTIHFGTIRRADNSIVDEVLVSLFKAPNSFTRENVVEISCHGSPYVVRELLQLFIQMGARQARAGEFTLRAFLNGQFDLAQAEAVADLIQADSSAAHEAALNQMRGGFSQEISRLREKLIHFASLVELELDFSEEDVEFANRDDLRDTIVALQQTVKALIDSFSIGQAIKNGVPTVIAGKPNAGKSTLLNAFLNEEKAIVSDIAGTTRDVIEDELIIEGIHFRFIDTAGLRETQDAIEAIGVQRTQEKMQKAALILYLIDLAAETEAMVAEQLEVVKKLNKPYLLIGNKVDAASEGFVEQLKARYPIHFISAKDKTQLDELKQAILEKVNLDKIDTGSSLVTNTRHYENLSKTHAALSDVLHGLDSGITGDFLALDIRNALHHLGEITGEITTDDLLDNIFSKFCIGK